MYKEEILNFSQLLDKIKIRDFEGVICGLNVDFKVENGVIYTLGDGNKWHVMDTVSEDTINLLFSAQ